MSFDDKLEFHTNSYQTDFNRRNIKLIAGYAHLKFNNYENNIDQSKAYFVGDNVTDMGAAKAAGIKGIKINANDPLAQYLNQII